MMSIYLSRSFPRSTSVISEAIYPLLEEAPMALSKAVYGGQFNHNIHEHELNQLIQINGKV